RTLRPLRATALPGIPVAAPGALSRIHVARPGLAGEFPPPSTVGNDGRASRRALGFPVIGPAIIARPRPVVTPIRLLADAATPVGAPAAVTLPPRHALAAEIVNAAA